MSGAYEHAGWLAVCNVADFAKGRGSTVAENSNLETKDVFLTVMSMSGYVMIELLSDDGANQDVVYIIDTNSQQIRRMPEMKKLLNSTRAQDGRTLREVIVFAANDHISKSNVLDTIKGIQHQSGAYFRGLNMTILSVNIPQQRIVPEHSIVKNPVELLAEIRRSASDLRRISVHDPPVVWCGGRIGDIVRVKRHSENSLSAISYSLVY